MLDEYEKAIIELKEVISNISNAYLVEIVDNKTADEDCKSIQTHVVRTGYTYVIEIRKWLGEKLEYTNKELLESIDEYDIALDNMFTYNEKLFEDYPAIKLAENNTDKKIRVK